MPPSWPSTAKSRADRPHGAQVTDPVNVAAFGIVALDEQPEATSRVSASFPIAALWTKAMQTPTTIRPFARIVMHYATRGDRSRPRASRVGSVRTRGNCRKTTSRAGPDPDGDSDPDGEHPPLDRQGHSGTGSASALAAGGTA